MRTPPGQPGYLGVAHAAFEVQAADRRNILLNGADLPRLADRRELLARFDSFRQEVDASGVADGIDAHRQQALTMITSSRLAQALDLAREDARTLRRYGLDRSYPDERDGMHYLDQFLLARRVEALAKAKGGTVVRDEKVPGRPITNVVLVGAKLKDADLTPLAGIDTLEAVSLGYNTDLTDAGLKVLLKSPA